MSDFVIPKLNPDAIKRAVESSGSSDSKGDYKWHKLKNGPTYWVFLPPWPGSTKGEIFYRLKVHFVKDDNGGTKAFKCSKEKHGQCPLCDSAYALMADVETKKLGQDMSAKAKVLYNAVSLETKEEGILSFGNSVDTHVLYELNLDIMAGNDPTNYDSALSVMIDKNEDWKKTKARADSSKRLNISSLKNNYPNLAKLDQVYEDYTPEELKMVLNGNYDPKGMKNKKSANATSTPDFPQIVASANPVVVQHNQLLNNHVHHNNGQPANSAPVIAGFPSAQLPNSAPAATPPATQNLSPDVAYANSVLGL